MNTNLDPTRLLELAKAVHDADRRCAGLSEEEHARCEEYERTRKELWKAREGSNSAWEALRIYVAVGECE